MNIERIRGVALFALIAGLSLAGCDNNGHDDEPSNAAVSANELAVKQIKEKTCVDRQPQSINELTIVESKEAIDLATLSPGCSGT